MSGKIGGGTGDGERGALHSMGSVLTASGWRGLGGDQTVDFGAKKTRSFIAHGRKNLKAVRVAVASYNTIGGWVKKKDDGSRPGIGGRRGTRKRRRPETKAHSSRPNNIRVGVKKGSKNISC